MAARFADTGELIGALLTEDSASALPDGIDRLSAKFDPIFDILGHLDTEYRSGRTAHPGESLHLFLLGVSDRVVGRGVAQHLVAACLENGMRRGYRGAVTEATNKFSSTSSASKDSSCACSGHTRLTASMDARFLHRLLSTEGAF